MLKFIALFLISFSAFSSTSYHLTGTLVVKSAAPQKFEMIVEDGKTGTLELKKGKEVFTVEINPKKHNEELVDLSFFIFSNDGFKIKPRIITRLNHEGQVMVKDDKNVEVYRLNVIAQKNNLKI